MGQEFFYCLKRERDIRIKPKLSGGKARGLLVKSRLKNW